MMKEVEINGKKYPVRFDINSLCDFEEITGRSLLTRAVDVDIRFVRALVFVGLKGGCNYEGRKFDHTIESVGVLIGEHLKTHSSIDGIVSRFLPILQECLGIKQDDGQTNEEPGESAGGR